LQHDFILIIPSRRQLFLGFFSIGLSGFGGVLPLAHRMLVQQRRWLSEEEFTELLGLGQILPGPNIVNMSIAIGSRFHGVAGAWLAVAGLMLAPLVIVLSMAVLYDHYQSLPDVQGTLHGLASTAAGLLLAMVLRMGENRASRAGPADGPAYLHCRRRAALAIIAGAVGAGAHLHLAGVPSPATRSKIMLILLSLLASFSLFSLMAVGARSP
jgi:chromate transporter